MGVPTILAAGPQALNHVCGPKDDSWQVNLCRGVYDGSARVPAEVVKWLTTSGLNILVIFLVAWIANKILRRVVVNLGRSVGKGQSRMGRARSLVRRVTPAALVETQEIGLRSGQRREAILGILKSVVTGAVYAVAVFSALGEVGIDLGPLLAGASVLGVALGFGAQTLVTDFLGGTFILIEDQYGVGDEITFTPKAGGNPVTGVVEAISLRNTRLRAIDGSLWHVPNGEMRALGNLSQHWSRVVLDVEVHADSDIDVAKAAMSRSAEQLRENDPAILEPPAMWGVQDLSPGSVTLRLVMKVTPSAQFRITRALREEIKKAFDAEGVKMPEPTVVAPASGS